MKSLMVDRDLRRSSLKISTGSRPVVPVRSASESMAPLTAPHISPSPPNPPPRVEAIRMHESLKSGSDDSRFTLIITLSAQLKEFPLSFSKACDSNGGKMLYDSKALLCGTIMEVQDSSIRLNTGMRNAKKGVKH